MTASEYGHMHHSAPDDDELFPERVVAERHYQHISDFHTANYLAAGYLCECLRIFGVLIVEFLFHNELFFRRIWIVNLLWLSREEHEVMKCISLDNCPVNSHICAVRYHKPSAYRWNLWITHLRAVATAGKEYPLVVYAFYLNRLRIETVYGYIKCDVRVRKRWRNLHGL